MNRLTGEDVYIADKLFATLETRTRKWELGSGKTALLSDTVGFIRDIPHHLVASFRATLEEAIWADLLVHVADASSERVSEEISEVEKVLEDLGCERERQLLVLNKIDKIIDPAVYTILRERYPRALFISAAEAEGIDPLTETVLDRSGAIPVRVHLKANCSNGRLLSCIAKCASVESETYEGSTVFIDAVLPASAMKEIRAFGEDVEIIPHAEALE